MCDREQKIKKMFQADTKEHQMHILLDSGMYRHLRFDNRGSSIYQFDIVTHPGYLTMTGDCGCWIFRRTLDMFEFFRSTPYGSINPMYWAEKLEAQDKCCGLFQFSPDRVRTQLLDWAKGRAEQCETVKIERQALKTLKVELEEQIFGKLDDCQTDAQVFELMEDFYSTTDINFGDDGMDYQFREFTHRYIWACWAIRWAVEQYDKLKGDPCKIVSIYS